MPTYFRPSRFAATQVLPLFPAANGWNQRILCRVVLNQCFKQIDRPRTRMLTGQLVRQMGCPIGDEEVERLLSAVRVDRGGVPASTFMMIGSPAVSPTGTRLRPVFCAPKRCGCRRRTSPRRTAGRRAAENTPESPRFEHSHRLFADLLEPLPIAFGIIVLLSSVMVLVVHSPRRIENHGVERVGRGTREVFRPSPQMMVSALSFGFSLVLGASAISRATRSCCQWRFTLPVWSIRSRKWPYFSGSLSAASTTSSIFSSVVPEIPEVACYDISGLSLLTVGQSFPNGTPRSPA